MQQEQIPKIIVIDLGSQFTHLITKNLRENKIYSEVTSIENFKNKLDSNTKGIVISGGPRSVNPNDIDELNLIKTALNADIPILAICYGMQLICQYFGGTINQSSNSEFSNTELTIRQNSLLLTDIAEIGKKYNIWMSHSDEVSEIPKEFSVIAESETCKHAFISWESKKIFCMQFHPEVKHCNLGSDIIKNFVKLACDCAPSWEPQNYMEEATQYIQDHITDEKILCAISGGIDSTVLSVLLSKTLPANQVKYVLIDNGLMREGEVDKIKQTMIESFNIEIKVIEASEDFINALANVTDPEQKRKIIGNKFIEVFQKEIKDVTVLAQGTLYPDIIESFSPAGKMTIKSHHNVGGLPKDMKLKLLEPFKHLFKDEVRSIGKIFKIPSDILNRHPFPGPGLAIRIAGEVTRERLSLLRKIDHIYMNELKKHNIYQDIWQSFVVLLPVKSVGVIGDKRSYGYSCVIRAVCSQDGMTANFYPFDMKTLNKISNTITNQAPEITRVLYDVTNKPPATIEWE